MNSKISVIIPIYNAEKTIKRCVESLIQGSFQEIEVILIDDCSQDKSWDVCCSLSKQHENVICFRNEHNSGVSYTRNHGLDKATGKFILFVDSDDWVSSDYVEKLLTEAEVHPDELVICGLHFINEVDRYQREYLWKNGGEQRYTVEQQDFFELLDRFQLQQLWNKIFRHDIIEKNHICFDESQSMGEDFEFVLDYMKEAEIKRCCVINEPLYNYIRANNTSLMSKFGLSSVERSLSRIEKLADIAGKDDPIIQAQLQQEKTKQQKNAVYFISRSEEVSINQKLKAIEDVMQDGQAMRYLLREISTIGKEKLSTLLTGKYI